jgi:hypothetical protein
LGERGLLAGLTGSTPVRPDPVDLPGDRIAIDRVCDQLKLDVLEPRRLAAVPADSD